MSAYMLDSLSLNGTCSSSLMHPGDSGAVAVYCNTSTLGELPGSGNGEGVAGAHELTLSLPGDSGAE
jgi:hypothetical protein